MNRLILIIAAMLVVATNASAQSTTDSTLLRLDTLNVGQQLRQAHVLRYTAAATAIAGTFAGLHLYRQADRTEETIATFAAAGVATLLQLIIAEVKSFRSYAILERLHPVPNGIALRF